MNATEVPHSELAPSSTAARLRFKPADAATLLRLPGAICGVHDVNTTATGFAALLSQPCKRGRDSAGMGFHTNIYEIYESSMFNVRCEAGDSGAMVVAMYRCS